MQLSNVRAVVTGGVSGLGLAVARHLVENGGKVALFDLNDDKGAAAVAELGAANARYIRTDVTDEAGVVANVAAARAFLGGLNVAVNCAGILGAGRVLAWSSGLDGIWNDLPLQPVFLPFLHQAAKYAAGYKEERPWALVGDVVSSPSPASGTPSVAVTPSGRRVSLGTAAGAPASPSRRPRDWRRRRPTGPLRTVSPRTAG